ncbi:MAG: ATP-binding protein [Candidatus Aenigmarchaeota archaeon]|nr:ATP-binding protein [Candidatus Aenigmarchaeota archaeon]
MQKDYIFEILSDWNLWGKKLDTGIKREKYLDELVNLTTNTNQVICIAGVRRSGKSTIMRQIAKEVEDGANTLIVNFEDERFPERNLKLLTDIYNTYLEKIKPKKKPFIFLDEIQEIPEWEKFVRGVHERKEANIIVSGSSSKLLSAELATLLTGRHITFFIYPLSLREFLKFKNLPANKEVEILAKRTEIKGLISEYMEYGGFPEVCLSSEKKRILLSYFDTIITRDIIDRFNIREKEKIKILAKYYFTNISSPITFNKISKFLKLPLTTVERFSEYLETASLIFFVKRFSYSLKEQENSPRKVYSIDTGMSNTLGFRFIEKLGKIMENIVALELKRRQMFNPSFEFYYWKDYQQREVDFVVKEGLKVKQLIQVCFDINNRETKEREIKALLKGIKEFKLKEGLIITEDLEKEEIIEDIKIIYKPLWKWLLF